MVGGGTVYPPFGGYLTKCQPKLTFVKLNDEPGLCREPEPQPLVLEESL